VTLLDSGNSDAAAVLLQRLRVLDPDSTSVLEALARALFTSRRYDEAADAFGELTERSPADDYAHYGLGMSLWRLQRFPQARDELAMAFVMRPDRSEYGTALTQVKATLRARSEGGLPLEGPLQP
jgi:Flp pilus assembly protein TadD